jgi:molybdopterin-guanine dinucleotide biosynthesis protein A
MTIKPYILIGGRSSRFGCDKATFEYNGETLAGRALRIVESAFPSTEGTFVSTNDGSFLGRPMIADIYPDRGAAGAIHAALNDASDGWIFVLACDLPNVTADLIQKLTNHINDEYGCVIPVQPDGQWQPLCGLYQVAKCLEAFEEAVSGRGRHASLRAIAESVGPHVVEFAEYAEMPDSQRLFMNVNSIADLTSI